MPQSAFPRRSAALRACPALHWNPPDLGSWLGKAICSFFVQGQKDPWQSEMWLCRQLQLAAQRSILLLVLLDKIIMLLSSDAFCMLNSLKDIGAVKVSVKIRGRELEIAMKYFQAVYRETSSFSPFLILPSTQRKAPPAHHLGPVLPIAWQGNLGTASRLGVLATCSSLALRKAVGVCM